MTYILPNGPFTVRMDHQAVQVISIPTESVSKAAWWLIREYCVNWQNKLNFNSLLMDNDGLSIICHPDKIAALQLLNIDNMVISNQKWISLVINVMGSASELPGVVYYLANALSKEGVSILHISTFESEVFLVQEHDIDRACDILKKIGNLKLYSQMVNQNQNRSGSSSGYSSSSSGSGAEDGGTTTSPVLQEGFTLKVLPCHLMLTKLNTEHNFSLSQCSSVLMKLLLYDSRFSPLEKIIQKHETSLTNRSGASGASGNMNNTNSTNGSNNNSNNQQQQQSRQGVLHRTPLSSSSSSTTSFSTSSFMWGIWQSGDEVTLLLEESDIHHFPPGALQVSPQHWRVIKLSGRTVGFDETGIVSAMSQVESGIPALNISTASTNCTLVPDELLYVTLDSLSVTLNVPADTSEVDGALY